LSVTIKTASACPNFQEISQELDAPNEAQDLLVLSILKKALN